jgi:hypothetical protein
VRPSAAAVVACACWLVFAASTAASPRKVYTIRLNDGFLVAASNVYCLAQTGKKLLKGQTVIACYVLRDGATINGSYAVGLGATGEIAVAKVKETGVAVVFRRKPSSLHAGSKTITVKPGDQVILARTDLACAVNTSKATGTYPTCFRVTKTGGRPNSYGFAETRGFVAVVRFDATGKRSKIVFKRDHGS